MSHLDETNIEFESYRRDWQTCRDAIEGKDAIFSGGERYLPKLDDMSDTEYEAYQMRAGWYGATDGTKGAFQGMIMRKDPVLSFPGGMDDFVGDATLSGVSVQELTNNILDEVFEVGRCGLLVDHEAQRGEQPMTRAQVERSNLRPYLTLYEAEQILPPKMGYVNNKYVVTQLRLKESVEVEGDDEFDTGYKDQIRVLDLFEDTYRVRLFRSKTKENAEGNIIETNVYEQFGEDLFPEMQGSRLDHIPFVFVNSNDLSPDYSKPPLLDLAELNIDYYRTKADYKHGLHFTGLPTAFISGVQEDDKVFKIGSTTAWIFRDADASADFLEFTGQGLSELREELKSLKDDMASLGARMLASEKRAAETAQAHLIKRTGEHSLLASIAQNVSEGLTKACDIAREWYGASEEANVQLNTDFLPVDLSADDVLKLIQAAQSPQSPFSNQDLLWNLRKGERLDPALEDDERMAKMETEPDLNFNQNGQ